MRRAFTYAVLAIVVFQVGNTTANAQLITSASNNLQTNLYYTVKDYSDAIPELKGIISIAEEDAMLGDVLKEIAKKANLGIAVNADLEILKKIISVDVRHTTVSNALRTTLLGTGFEAAVSKNRELLLVKNSPIPPIEKKVLRKDIRGTVTDAETGDPVPAANVLVKDTNIGTSTQADGTFELTVPDDAEILVVRFLGYKTHEVPIGNTTVFNIELEVDMAALEDVIVVGYGTQQRTEVTGSVASIRAETIENSPVTSFENALQGRLAGVNVAESSGEPGAAPQITIRGTGSISAGNDPLYVIDGVPLSQNVDQQGQVGSQRASFQPPPASPLASINPNTIESIEVLKDASAAAIYGSRGSNGVIIVTTKKGQKNMAPQVNVRSYTGFQTVFNTPDLMNAEEIIAYTKDSRNNTYLRDADPLNENSPLYNPQYDPNTNVGRPEEGTDDYNTNYIIPEEYVNWDGTDTDWLDLVLETARLQNYDLSVSGGSENMTYLIAGGFLDQSGIIGGSDFDRYSVKTNLTGDISEDIQVGFQLNAAFTENDRKSANAPYFGTPPGIIYSAMTNSPVVSPYNEDGTYRQLDGSHNSLVGGMTTTNHPLAVRDFIDEKIKNNRVFGNLYGTYEIMDKLEFKSLVGYDVDNYQRSFYQGTQLYYRGGDPRPYAQSSSAQSFNYLWENTLSYVDSFGEDHRLDAVAGYTVQKQTDERNSVIAQNFPDDQVKTVGGGQITGGSQAIEEWTLVSALARANYVFKNRYMFTGSIRSDRSSRFGFKDQTGIFPSASFGWQVTNEPFMEDVNFFNQLKPRVSYGVTGNFQIGNYSSIGLLSSSSYVFNDQVASGVVPTTLSNNELTWETTRQMNVGVDYAFLNDRFYGSFDYYISKTEDLLLNVNIPSVTGFMSALTNVGEVENKGFEVQLTSRNVVSNFNWSTDLNLAFNHNEVKTLGPEGDPILVPGAAGVRHITQIGSEIGSYYGYEVEGIFQTQEEINNAPVDLEGDPTPGDFRFRDVSGDGFIDADDRTVLGSYHPDLVWGINNRFNWKNLDFSFFIQGVEGREILNLTMRHLRNGEANFGSYAVLNDRWISPEQPGNGIDPKADRVSAGNNNRESSYQVEDGSYVKLKNITLGYNLPLDVVNSFASNVRLYGSVTNVAIWTDYTGFNPEVNLQPGSGLTPGEDYGTYPLSRAFQVGIDISF